MEKIYPGIMVYEILPDGNLNGIGADTYKNHIAGYCVNEDFLYNESARKIDGHPNDIMGRYTTSYMDENANYVIGNLEISKGVDENDGQFVFNWTLNGISRFKGIGWKTRNYQLVVRYENVTVKE